MTIPSGSGDFQEMESPDEFEDGESPADYSVNVLEEVGANPWPHFLTVRSKGRASSR